MTKKTRLQRNVDSHTTLFTLTCKQKGTTNKGAGLVWFWGLWIETHTTQTQTHRHTDTHRHTHRHTHTHTHTHKRVVAG